MLHFNKKTEYALLAIEHMALKAHHDSAITSAREIAEAYKIPYTLLAKVLQQLAVTGLIKSIHGTKGGYVLVKKPTDITVADIVEIFDGPVAVAECFKEARITCPQWNGCLIKDPFSELNHKVYTLLTQTSVADLALKESENPLPTYKES